MNYKYIIKNSNNNSNLDYIYDNYICFQNYIYDKKLKETIIFYCIRENNKNLFEYILKKGCDINHKNIHGTTPIKTAIIQKKIYYVKKLLQYKPDLTIKDNMGFTPDYYISLNKYPKYNFINETAKEIEKIVTEYINDIKE
jgi:ankyrin repeat protein